MNKYLLAFILFFFLFPTTVKASCSFSEQFCEDYGIESYEELEDIYDIYSAALDYGINSYNMLEDVIISDFILSEELGVELVNELLNFQEQYGYGSIEKLLSVVDEIGYSELTGDYSYIHKNYEDDKPETITEKPDYKWCEHFMYELSAFCNRNWYFLLGIVSWGIIILYITLKSWNEKRK